MNQPRHDQTDDIDLFGELSSGQASRDHLAQVAKDSQLTYHDPKPIGAQLPTIDDEITLTEVEIRERLIEWLVGFLPGGPRADRASL
jgi:hypothetical protein